jgi:D-alanyl-D-alanine carboxypeptidase
MMEKEKGNIHLDTKILQYLPDTLRNKITGADKITVRMLLNHSSGLMNFTDLPEYLGRQFQDPSNQPSLAEIIDMSSGRDLLSEPGTKYFYSNTNYLLLHVILQQVTGKSYAELLQERIIKRLSLKETYFQVSPAKASQMGFPHYYADLQGTDQLTDVTMWNHFLGNASYGWGGISGTPTDAILFYEALMKGRVVTKQSLNEMLIWFQETGSEYPSYGLGIEYWQFRKGSTPQRGHEGDGIGNSTMVLYVPDNDTYLFINITAGRRIPGPYLFKVTDLKNELGRYVANWR